MTLKFIQNTFSFLLVFIAWNIQAQVVQIKMGNTQIALNEYFTLTITLQNEQIRNYTNFPDIQGFVKREVSSGTQTSFINGKMSMSSTITQNYQASKEGKFTLKPFSIKINGIDASSGGGQIKVGPPKQVSNNPFDAFGADPFEEFFAGRQNPKEFIDVEDEAFLMLMTSKDKVYKGEGVTATLAFCVSEQNKAKLDFPRDLSKQLGEAIQKLKPSNCLEENFSIEEIIAEERVIDGKNYRIYPLFKAAYFSLNTENIVFPSVGIKMVKYKMAKNPSFFGANAQEDSKWYYSKAKVIKVRDLPIHPLKNEVSVGNYALEEEINKRNLVAGKSFNYQFRIVGEGNISDIRDLHMTEGGNIEIYPPNTLMDIQRAHQNISGSKTFNFYMIPKEPGKLALKDYVQWIFFNTQKGRYDTLTSKYVLQIKGESTKDQSVGSGMNDAFKTMISKQSNEFVDEEQDKQIKWLVNIFLISLITIAIFILFKK